MSGQTSLPLLLRSMSPQLNEGDYVFCTLAEDTPLQGRSVIASIREQEGLSVVLARQDADALGLTYDYVAAWITLSVHSALAAVGLTAAFAGALGRADISCNVIAGFYHDHLFVARTDAARAMAVLKQLAAHGE